MLRSLVVDSGCGYIITRNVEGYGLASDFLPGKVMVEAQDVQRQSLALSAIEALMGRQDRIENRKICSA